MIREITNYVVGSFKCSTTDNFSIESNIIYEFNTLPNLNMIKETCLNWCNENYPDYKWENCVIISLDFLSKHAFDILSGNEESI